MKIKHNNIILFREAVKQRRLELNMSQKELATLVGYNSASSISKIEKGDYTPLSKLEAFATALETTPENLISFEERMGRVFEGEIIKKH